MTEACAQEICLQLTIKHVRMKLQDMALADGMVTVQDMIVLLDFRLWYDPNTGYDHFVRP